MYLEQLTISKIMNLIMEDPNMLKRLPMILV